jgi:hypothetical protein
VPEAQVAGPWATFTYSNSLHPRMPLEEEARFRAFTSPELISPLSARVAPIDLFSPPKASGNKEKSLLVKIPLQARWCDWKTQAVGIRGGGRGLISLRFPRARA